MSSAICFGKINYFIYIYNRIEVRITLVINVFNKFFCAKVNKNIYVFLKFEVMKDNLELVIFSSHDWSKYLYNFKEIFIKMGNKNCVDKGVKNLIDEKNLFLVEGLGKIWKLKIMNNNDIITK